jgi:hypothetical protein
VHLAEEEMFSIFGVGVSMNDALSLLVIFTLLVVIIGTFIRICVKLRRGGGSMTTIVLGATDAFLSHDRRKAAETIVNENAGKKFQQLPSPGPPTSGSSETP